MCRPYDTSLAITVSAAYCSAGIAFCGLLSMLAMSQKPNIHWMMMLDMALEAGRHYSLAGCEDSRVDVVAIFLTLSRPQKDGAGQAF